MVTTNVSIDYRITFCAAEGDLITILTKAQHALKASGFRICGSQGWADIDVFHDEAVPDGQTHRLQESALDQAPLADAHAFYVELASSAFNFGFQVDRLDRGLTQGCVSIYKSSLDGLFRSRNEALFYGALTVVAAACGATHGVESTYNDLKLLQPFDIEEAFKDGSRFGLFSCAEYTPEAIDRLILDRIAQSRPRISRLAEYWIIEDF